MMMRTMMMLMMALAASAPAMAAEVQKKVVATWAYDEALALEQGIQGFRLRDAGNKVLIDSIPPAARTATALVTTDGKACQSYYLTAYTADDETAPSNILTWCPPRRTLTGVGTFTIEVKDP